MSFSSVRPFPNSDGWSLEGTSSNPPVCPSQGASVHHPLPEDWPVPQALHGPAYLSAETSSAVMAAVAVDSAAIVPLRWWANGRDTACEKNRGIRDTRDLFRDRKWQIGDPARLGPLIYQGPSPRLSTSGSSPSSLKGQDPAPNQPKDIPARTIWFCRVPFLPSLPSSKKATFCFSSKSRKN